MLPVTGFYLFGQAKTIKIEPWWRRARQIENGQATNKSLSRNPSRQQSNFIVKFGIDLLLLKSIFCLGYCFVFFVFHRRTVNVFGIVEDIVKRDAIVNTPLESFSNIFAS